MVGAHVKHVKFKTFEPMRLMNSVDSVWRSYEYEIFKRDLPRLEEPIPSTSNERQQNRRSNVVIIYERLAFRYDTTVNYAGDKSVDFGTMSIICQYCNALRFRFEPTGLCCANGKVKLPQLIAPPEPLNSLLSGQGSLSKHFLQNIQAYNSVFQMTSFGANIIEQRGFNPTFKVFYSSVTFINTHTLQILQYQPACIIILWKSKFY